MFLYHPEPCFYFLVHPRAPALFLNIKREYPAEIQTTLSRREDRLTERNVPQQNCQPVLPEALETHVAPRHRPSRCPEITKRSTAPKHQRWPTSPRSGHYGQNSTLGTPLGPLTAPLCL